MQSSQSTNRTPQKVWMDVDVHITAIRLLLGCLVLLESTEGSPRDVQDQLSQLGNLSKALLYHVNHSKFWPLEERLKSIVKSDGVEMTLLLRY